MKTEPCPRLIKKPKLRKERPAIINQLSIFDPRPVHARAPRARRLRVLKESADSQLKRPEISCALVLRAANADYASPTYVSGVFTLRSPTRTPERLRRMANLHMHHSSWLCARLRPFTMSQQNGMKRRTRARK
jgi:hypothetical protein